MPFGVGEVIGFFVGVIVGRYFEQIVDGIARFRKDLSKAQNKISKQINR